MKTTSYEISKKLAEIGFSRNRPASDRGYDKNGNCCLVVNFRKEVIYNAFDLETILEALPNILPNKDNYYFTMTKYAMWYCDIRNREELYLLSVHKKGHSLADIAALLLITLHEKGLIEFDK